MPGSQKVNDLIAPSKIQSAVSLLDDPVCGLVKVEFTGNALEQMRDREVTKQDVIRAIRRPNREGLPTQPGRKRVRWNKTRLVAIDAVYEILEDRIRVITAHKSPRPLARREES